MWRLQHQQVRWRPTGVQPRAAGGRRPAQAGVARHAAPGAGPAGSLARCAGHRTTHPLLLTVRLCCFRASVCGAEVHAANPRRKLEPNDFELLRIVGQVRGRGVV